MEPTSVRVRMTNQVHNAANANITERCYNFFPAETHSLRVFLSRGCRHYNQEKREIITDPRSSLIQLLYFCDSVGSTEMVYMVEHLSGLQGHRIAV
jgi:hypothetical protein